MDADFIIEVYCLPGNDQLHRFTPGVGSFPVVNDQPDFIFRARWHPGQRMAWGMPGKNTPLKNSTYYITFKRPDTQ